MNREHERENTGEGKCHEIKSDAATAHMMNHADMVQSEFDFIYLMIPHHQEAIDTSRLLLQTTKNPELLTL
jgi:uncharacterized protein (DUF305 family)